MSKESPETKRVVTLEELIARADELKESIEALDATINTYLSHYREIQLAQETLKNLGDAPSEGYIVLDRLSSVMIPARISENWYNNLLVNLGLGYYLKTTREVALEILRKRLEALEKAINALQARRRALAEEYIGIQRVIEQVVEAQRESSKTSK